jgi:hypothetical protein
MRFAIYVPKWQAERWENDPLQGEQAFRTFLSNLAEVAGGYTMFQAIGGYKSTPTEAVWVVEALIRLPGPDKYRETWALFRAYAQQLLDQGEESVLIVSDNEPTLITK